MKSHGERPAATAMRIDRVSSGSENLPTASAASLSFDRQVDLDMVSGGCLFVVQTSRASSFQEKMVG
jgi:hypothetical protein